MLMLLQSFVQRRILSTTHLPLFHNACNSSRHHLSTTSTKTTAKTNAETLLIDGDFKGRKYTSLSTFPVRWIDIDIMGHVDNARFFTYFEQIRCENFDAVGLNIGGSLPEGPILAKISCSYRGPLLFPDTVTVGALSEQTSENTWQQHYAIVGHASGRVVAEGIAELVWFDYKNGVRKSFSADAKRRLFGLS